MEFVPEITVTGRGGYTAQKLAAMAAPGLMQINPRRIDQEIPRRVA